MSSTAQEVSKALPGSIFLNEASERYLLHGAGPDTVMQILHSGFDQSLAGLRGMFGDGCYFAEDSEKMDQYGKAEKEMTPGLEKLYGSGNKRPGDVFYCIVVRRNWYFCLAFSIYTFFQTFSDVFFETNFFVKLFWMFFSKSVCVETQDSRLRGFQTNGTRASRPEMWILARKFETQWICRSLT